MAGPFINSAIEKLRDRRGAGLIFSMVIFVIVTMFCFVMVEAALSFAQNSNLGDAQDRAYYASTSAARLLCGEITGLSSGVRRTRTEWSCDAATNPNAAAHPELYHGTIPLNPDSQTAYFPTAFVTEADPTELLLIQMVERIDTLPELSDALPTAAVEFAFTSPDSDGTEALPAHGSAELTMRRDYSILAVVKNSAEDFTSVFTVTLLFRAVNRDTVTEEAIPLWHEEPEESFGESEKDEPPSVVIVSDGFQIIRTVQTSFQWEIESVKGGAPYEA